MSRTSDFKYKCIRCGKMYQPGDLDFCDECDALILEFLKPEHAKGATKRFFETALPIIFT